jgi:hypothetical protein
MALVKINPVSARVRWDRSRNRPATIRIGERQLTVTTVQAVRDEVAAFRPELGPRVTYLLGTDAGDASLVFDARRRRWYVEALDQAA